MTTDAQRKLADLAAAMAAANPDASEFLAGELARMARQAKTPVPVGITLRINRVANQIEIRGGELQAAYVDGDPAASYAEHIIPIPVPAPRVGTKKE